MGGGGCKCILFSLFLNKKASFKGIYPLHGIHIWIFFQNRKKKKIEQSLFTDNVIFDFAWRFRTRQRSLDATENQNHRIPGQFINKPYHISHETKLWIKLWFTFLLYEYQLMWVFNTVSEHFIALGYLDLTVLANFWFCYWLMKISNLWGFINRNNVTRCI